MSEKFSLILRIISIYISVISLIFAIKKMRREKIEREFFRARLDRARRRDVGIFHQKEEDKEQTIREKYSLKR